jgi:hypothetical protein
MQWDTHDHMLHFIEHAPAAPCKPTIADTVDDALLQLFEEIQTPLPYGEIVNRYAERHHKKLGTAKDHVAKAIARKTLADTGSGLYLPDAWAFGR